MITKSLLVSQEELKKYIYKIVLHVDNKYLIVAFDTDGNGKYVCTGNYELRKEVDAFVIHDGVNELERLAMKEYAKRFGKIVLDVKEIDLCKKILI